MRSNKEVILLNISGPDKPGITTTLTHILAQYNVGILDIGQAVIHDELALGILFEVTEDRESSPILKDLLFRSYELGMNAKFTPISLEHYEDWVQVAGKGTVHGHPDRLHDQRTAYCPCYGYHL